MAQVQTNVAWIKENVTWPATLSRKGQDHGDSRTRLTGLEGHPMFPVVPSSQGMASFSGSVLHGGSFQPTGD